MIPKGMHLIVDVDRVPRLKAVVVQGSLIFLPHTSDKTHTRYFDAEYIYVDGGLLEIGTESQPYDSKIVVTLYGSEKSASIPIYGNKVIANRAGVIDIHGKAVTHSWLELYSTAEVGDNTIVLNTSDAIPWATGDRVVIAPTGFNFREAEECGIQSATTEGGRPKLTLDCALKFQHYAASETYGSDTL